MTDEIIKGADYAAPKLVSDLIASSLNSERKRNINLSFRMNSTLLSIIKNTIQEFVNDGAKANLSKFFDESIVASRTFRADTQNEKYIIGLLVHVSDEVNEIARLANALTAKMTEKRARYYQYKVGTDLHAINKLIMEEAECFNDDSEIEVTSTPLTPSKYTPVIDAEDDVESNLVKVDICISGEAALKMGFAEFVSKTDFVIQSATKGYVRNVDPSLESVKFTYLRHLLRNISSIRRSTEKAVSASLLDKHYAFLLSLELEQLQSSALALAAPAKLKVQER